MKLNKRLIAPMLGLASCMAIGVGTTYALFTSEDDVNIAVTAGKVKLTAALEELETFSGAWNEQTSAYDYVQNAGTTFANGGTATLDDKTLTLDKITPLDKVTFNVVIRNESNVAAKYRVNTTPSGDIELLSALDITLGGEEYNGLTASSKWAELEIGAVITVPVSITFADHGEADNALMEKSIALQYGVEAVQGNAMTVDTPDNVVPLSNANDLRIASTLVNAGKLDGKTLQLMDDVDLGGVEWNQINGAGHNVTFDGDNHVISNLKVSQGHNAGFFATSSSCTIKNVTFDQADVSGVGRVAVVAGHGMCVKVEGVTVKNSSIKAIVTDGDDGDKAGAIVGYLSGEPTAWVKNCTVENTEVEGYRDIGALVGYAGGTYEVSGNSVKDCVVTANMTENYKNYTEFDQYDVRKVIGEAGTAGTVDGNSDTNVTVEKIIPLTADTVETAIEQAGEGDTLLIPENTKVEIPASVGTASVPLTGVTLSGSGEGSKIVLPKYNTFNAKNVVFENLEVELGGVQTNDGALAVGETSVFDHVVFKYRLTCPTYAVKMDNVAEVLFKSCRWDMKGNSRGIIFWDRCNANVTIDDCYFDCLYPFNVNASTSNPIITVKNSTLKGWTSWGAGTVSFLKCNFGKSTSNWAYIRPYVSTTFTECEFSTETLVDVASANAVATFVRCTQGGAALTTAIQETDEPGPGSFVYINE